MKFKEILNNNEINFQLIILKLYEIYPLIYETTKNKKKENNLFF